MNLKTGSGSTRTCLICAALAMAASLLWIWPEEKTGGMASRVGNEVDVADRRAPQHDPNTDTSMVAERSSADASQLARPSESHSAERADPVRHAPAAIPVDAQDAVRYLNHFLVPIPDIATDADWRRLTLTVEACRKDILAAGTETNRAISRTAQRRRDSGHFEAFRFEGQPSKSDPEWESKWPWLRSLPGEQREVQITYDGTSQIAKLVRIFPGEDAAVDAAVEKKKSLVDRMRLDVSMIGR